MKKKMATIVMIVVFVMSLIGCSTASVEEYRYADEWENEISFTQEDGTPVNLREDEKLDGILSECKEMILSTNLKSEYPYFNWDLFDEVKIYASDGIQLESKQVISDGYEAKYFFSLNIISVFPVCSEYTNEYLETIILHELIHTLTYSEEGCVSQLWEGVADYYAAQVSQKYNLSFEFQYINEIYFLVSLKNIFGEKDTMEMIFQGTLDNKIDELTKEGMGEKFEEALIIICNYYEIYGTDEYDNLIRVEQDIICHVAHNYCKNIEKDDREVILENCENMLMIQEEYFEKLLE